MLQDYGDVMGKAIAEHPTVVVIMSVDSSFEDYVIKHGVCAFTRSCFQRRDHLYCYFAWVGNLED